MRILISGVRGFVGSTLAKSLHASGRGRQISGFDNFIRPGRGGSRAGLKAPGVKLFHADRRTAGAYTR